MIIAVFIYVSDDLGTFTRCIQLHECAMNLILNSVLFLMVTDFHYTRNEEGYSF